VNLQLPLVRLGEFPEGIAVSGSGS
jgi:hypothetical protein